MPSHKIHLAIANELNKELKMDLDSLMIGSVLPDLALNDHGVSHYQVEGTYDSELANPDKFLNEYKEDMRNPVMIGYLIHLLTDRFYNDYYFRNHCIFNDNGIPVAAKLRNGKVIEKIKIPKQSDFFKYDKWLLKNNRVEKFKSDNCINNIYDLSIAQFDIDKIKKYITDSNNDKIRNLKTNLFYKSISKKELDSVYINCIEYIKNYLTFHEIIKS